MSLGSGLLGRRGTRCLASFASHAVPWPDLRLWVRRLPDGTAHISQERTPDAALAFDAYSRQLPGTREVNLGEARFFAFQAPRVGAEHLVVWRREQDVREAAGHWAAPGVRPGDFESDVGVRVTPRSEREQLTAAVWCWDKLDVKDPNRYWDDGRGASWMYWESFWAPAEDAEDAAPCPAFGDAAGAMLAPALAPGGPQAEDFDSDIGRNLRAASWVGPSDGDAVASTAVGRVPKDRAYAVVYEYNVWGSEVSRSGTGSDLWSPEARLAITAIEAVMDRFGVRSMLDCACGDATWMVPYLVARHPELEYCGIDIVPEVIEQNRQRHPGVQFHAIDLAESPLPSGADMIFSKETLNHMGLEDAQQALRRFAATGARYLLTSVHEGADNSKGLNKNCFTTYIHYDYELPPFNMKKVASVIEYQGPQTSYTVFELNPSGP